VLRLLEAVERCNTTDTERALAELRALTGYTERPGPLRCAWCKRVLEARHIEDPRGSDGICAECLPEFLRVAGVKVGEVE
jgi:hypothetical protein